MKNASATAKEWHRRDRGLPLAKWSTPDIQFWNNAFPDDPWRRALAAKNPKRKQQAERTLRNQRQSLEFFFGMLTRDAPEQMQLPWAQRFNPDNFILWQDDLEDNNKPQSIHDHFSRVKHALATLIPGVNFSWINSMANEIPGRSRRSQRPRSNTSALAIREHAYAAMTALMPALRDDRTTEFPDASAESFRDLLMVAFLTCDPLRLANFLDIEIYNSLEKFGTGYNVYFSADKMRKTHMAHTWSLLKTITPFIDFYLAFVRTRIHPNVAGDHLWVSRKLPRMPAISAHTSITRTTFELVGERLTCHDFRHIFGDTLVKQDRPLEEIQDGLGHVRGSSMTERTYLGVKRPFGRELAARNFRAKVAIARKCKRG
jgi:integrase